MSIVVDQEVNYDSIKKMVGKGHFGSVYQTLHLPTQLNVALKIVPKSSLSKTRKDSLFKEIQILQSLHHPLIAEFLDFFQTKSHLFIVMEYVTNGNLRQYIQKNGLFEENQTRRIFMQILSVLQYLHEKKNIVHRDIKLENILLDENYNIRFIDFGLSKYIENEKSSLHTQCGSPLYIAPEIILGQPYSNKCDLWSAGVILYFMTSNSFPFSARNFQLLYQKIVENEPNYSNKSEELNQVIRSLLTQNSEYRLSFCQLRKLKWFSDHKYENLLENIVGRTMSYYVIDQEIKSMVISLGIDCQNLHKYLLEDKIDLCTIPYILLRKEKITRILKELDIFQVLESNIDTIPPQNSSFIPKSKRRTTQDDPFNQNNIRKFRPVLFKPASFKSVPSSIRRAIPIINRIHLRLSIFHSVNRRFSNIIH
jgi:serine/threonine protein kinase